MDRDVRPALTVCSKGQVPGRVKDFEATHVISLLDPGERLFRPTRILPRHHLQLSFEDEEDPGHHAAPRRWHAQRLVDFAAALPPESRVVVHCAAGVCRSTAAALGLWLRISGSDRLDDARTWLMDDRPEAVPNLLLAGHLDEILGLGGALRNMCQDIGDQAVAVKIAGLR